ncbi:MAG: LamG-like jellyroll fold domain-containing protein [Flavobacteriales bacterium]
MDRLSLNLTTLGSSLKHLTIRLRNYGFSTLSKFENVSLTTVYERNTTFTGTGTHVFNLSEVFEWNGSSNLLVDISYTNDQAGANTSVEAMTQSSNLAVAASGNDGYVEFSRNRNRIEVPLDGYDFGDEITISFWCYGNADKLPANTSIFEAIDFDGNRALNCHMPWGDGTVYWDAGTGSGYDRISKAATASIYEGTWNHWALVKNATSGQMKIYLNGNLWVSGTGKDRTIGEIQKLIIGSGMTGNAYFGKLDDFRIWKKEISQADIQAWMNKDITSSHPNYSDLALYLKFDNGYNLINSAPSSLVAYWHGAPTVKTYPGTEMFRVFNSPTIVPEISFYQGEYVSNNSSTIKTDTVAQPPYSIVEYAVAGNYVKAVNGTYTRGSGHTYTYNPSGQAIDSTQFTGTQLWTNGDLTYYEPPFEIVDRYEIGRFITPYGIGLDLGSDGFTWMYDVTDYANLLKGSVDLASGNQQELLDLKFAFVHGTPPAPVVEITRPWGQSGSKSYSALDNDNALTQTTIAVNPNAKRQKVIARFTGHGHNSNTGNYPHCCEWKDNTHYLYVNGSQATQWHVWQTHDCALNPVYPQGGTWPGAREGWCPGDVVKDYEYDITNMVTGSTYNLDYSITPVPSNNEGMGNGNYIVAMHVIQYGQPANALDAEVYDVIAPTNRGYYSRMNPVCFAPKVVIRNNGSTELTSLKITYQVSGGIPKVYNWTGALGFLEKEQVELPFQDGAFYLGDGSNVFMASVSEPNGSQDGNTANDTFKSTFNLPEVIKNDVIIKFQTNNNPKDNVVRVYDATNTVVFERDGDDLSAATTYWDTLTLDTGCYRLEITDSEDDGLYYWAYTAQGSGSLSVWGKNNKLIKSFEPEFGNKVEYAFAVDAMTIDTVVVDIDGITVYVIGGDSFQIIEGQYVPYGIEQQPTGSASVNVYPNPSNGSFYVELMKYSGLVKLEILDINGKLVYSENIGVSKGFAKQYSLNLESGIYLLRVIGSNLNTTQKIVIER